MLVFSNFAFSQNILVEYDFFDKDEYKSKCELVITDSISIWRSEPTDPTTITDPGFFIKNYVENALYLNEKLLNLTFYVKDSLHSMKWNLTNDTSYMLNELCFSAKTNFRGRGYTAWYAPRYSSSDGPWKFGGLPGLILAVKSDSNYIEWKASKIINNYSKKIEPEKISNYKFISWDEYVAKYISSINRWIKLAKSNGTVAEGTKVNIKFLHLKSFIQKHRTEKV